MEPIVPETSGIIPAAGSIRKRRARAGWKVIEDDSRWFEPRHSRCELTGENWVWPVTRPSKTSLRRKPLVDQVGCLDCEYRVSDGAFIHPSGEGD